MAFLKSIAALTFALILATSASRAAERPPNFVIMLCDNLGYADVEPFGSELHRTPNLNRMAAEGRKFTHFYSASGVCTPSRAALMTGSYPKRIGLAHTESDGAVLRPVSPSGLNPDEITIAEVLKEQGYATAMFGKWHLGDQDKFLPTRQGFDVYYGVPYSDDMTPRPGKNWPPLPYMHNETVIDAPVDRNGLTRREAKHAIEFIETHQDEPFFVYIPHAMPGSTRAPFSSEKFRGKSANGPYGDSVEELDWAAGEILETLRRLDLAKNTLVIWTSDNGAPRRNPPQGRNTPLAGWGYSTAEGGMRVPMIAWWPGTVPAGTTCDELATMMDLLPTFAKLAGTQPPSDRVIDGKNIVPLLLGKEGAESPHEAFYYYQKETLEAIRAGDWKLYVAMENKPARLFDVRTDPGEKQNLAAEHPDVVARLEKLAEQARQDLGSGAESGERVRPLGHVESPVAQVMEE